MGEPDLLLGLRAALRADDPLDLLMLIGSLVAGLDPRAESPFHAGDDPTGTLDQLVESFLDVDFAETTAALTVLRTLVPEELLAERIGKVLDTRRQPMPLWLRGLDAPTVSRVVRMSHVLGDGDDYFVSTSSPVVGA